MTIDDPAISVVIPAHNRADAIALTLETLALQGGPEGGFEVIVVDDGSTDGTERVVAGGPKPFTLTYLKQERSGAGAARNAGAARACGAVLLFLDADVVPGPALLRAHLEAHGSGPQQLVVGRVKLWPAAPLPWCERVALQGTSGIDYGEVARPVPFSYALGGNTSIRRQVFQYMRGYDESLPDQVCEDIEFAYRSQKQGYMLFYQPDAVGYHNHARTLAQRCQQQTIYMRSMALLVHRHPETQTAIHDVDDLVPVLAPPRSPGAMHRRVAASVLGLAVVRQALYTALMRLDRLQASPRLTSFLYWRLMTGCRQAGFREGLRLYSSQHKAP